ncbi:hypothetical protein EC973_005085 [Apophysomyces ossiformis]|uniref:beta-glucosidase n=1 Tax=Apophysomyces ossiformis TaxID=679940 RepID=A0A8H7ESB2_9FUNG|nr:hypothetical protein EC973_005085 [Apophysomyces ossiformis]
MVSRMSLKEKIGQMTQLNQDLVLTPNGQLNRTAVEYYASKYFVGSYLNQLSRTFAPVLDIPVNKQWPRVYENFGEDPYLSSLMGIAAIRGYQGQYKSDRSKVAACMKHFIAYGAPWSGQDRDSTVISERILYDYFLPGFQAAINAGVATAMEAYIDINGEPVVASSKYLRHLLRDEMNFKGMLVTDWAEIDNLYTTHHVAASLKEAVKQSIGSTSVDMSMVPKHVVFFDALLELVKEGQVPESRVNESAERLLQLKKDLGLLEPDGYKARHELSNLVGSPGDIQVSLDAARESITLLKNNHSVLPLKGRRILVLGPTGNDISHLNGGWTIDWQGATADHWHGPTSDEQFYGKGVTIYQGVREAAPEDTIVDYLPGFDIDGNDINMAQVLRGLTKYDAIIACIGEHVYTELPGNIHDMRLPEGQVRYIHRLAKRGIPLISILVEGRPRVLGTVVDDSDALLQAYLPGSWGGKAIGEILFGKVNPSGKLPYTYPKHTSDLSLNYWRQVNDQWDPLFEFGYGLSYSRFDYSNIILYDDIPDLVLKVGQSRKIAIDISNKGPYDGKEVVLMYVQQTVRRITPPAKLLKNFQKVHLSNGETTTLVFEVNTDMFRYTGVNGVAAGTLDEGPVNVLIGDQQFSFEIRV